MALFRERNDPLRILGRRILLVLLSLFLISVTWALWDIYRKNGEAARLRAEAEGRLADLEEEHRRLEMDIANLETTRGREATLREQYALARAGEGLIVIVEPDRTEETQASPSPWGWIAKMFHW